MAKSVIGTETYYELQRYRTKQPKPVAVGIATRQSQPRVALVLGDNDFTTVTDTVTAGSATHAACLVRSLCRIVVAAVDIDRDGRILIDDRRGVWGNNNTVSWGFLSSTSCFG
ncbi:MAG: hypothetical protein R3C56_34400 [Pirellulaceae bacterium]